ncbi:MAG: transcriptional regulator [Alteromonadaceae bacterium]|nr:transcriptional regulator [Alteromonadaceae bacterium]|tara:strand:- start:441 stop:1178 length:738 start_codon:yes stop_codon:yes gene_type:complete
MTLGHRIKQLRQEYELSQPELADKIGIEQSYLSKLENDKALPSRDIFAGILTAFDMTTGQLLEPLIVEGLDTKLLQITQIEQYYQQCKRNGMNQVKRYVTTCIALIAVGCGCLYVNFSKSVFPETMYEYMSEGVVLAGEPEDIFVAWRRLTDDSRDAFEQKQREMIARESVDILLLPGYAGQKFLNPVSGGSRFYRFQEPVAVTRPVNGLFGMGGVVLLIMGLLGLIFERRLLGPAVPDRQTLSH